MKVLVVYDSMYGNTEQIAKAIGSACGASVLHAGQVKMDRLKGLDFLIIGSATQAFQPLQSMKVFLKEIPQGALKTIKVATFDTRMDIAAVNNRLLTMMTKLFGYAAQHISASLARKGGEVVASPIGFIVNDKQGPLKDGEIERAFQWAKQVIS